LDEIFLSIVIPAFNEEVVLSASLTNVAEFLEKQDYTAEVIVVDDCSDDKTNALASQFVKDRKSFSLIRNDRRTGKGGSVKKGMLAARGQVRLFCDADMSTPIDEIKKALNCLKTCDIVIGSRRVKGAYLGKRQPVFREAMGRVFSLIVRVVCLGGFLDTQCGFKMFSAKAAGKIFPLQTIDGFGFDVEILFIGIRAFGFKALEMPVRWYDNPKSAVRLAVHPLEMFLDLFRIRANQRKGLYRT